MIEDLYPRAVDCGIPPAMFWELSVMEVYDLMESYTRTRRRDMKDRLMTAFVQAESTAEHIGTYLNKDNKAREMWDFFPELFAEEKKLHEEAVEAEEAEKLRRSRVDYAREWNRRLRAQRGG